MDTDAGDLEEQGWVGALELIEISGARSNSGQGAGGPGGNGANGPPAPRSYPGFVVTKIAEDKCVGDLLYEYSCDPSPNPQGCLADEDIKTLFHPSAWPEMLD